MYISTQMGTAQSYLPAELDQLYCKTDLTCSFCGPLRSCYPPFAPQPGHQSQVARRSGPVEGRGRPKNGGLTRNSWPCGESHALNHGLKWGHLAGPRILWSHQRYVARHTHTHTPHRHTHIYLKTTFGIQMAVVPRLFLHLPIDFVLTTSNTHFGFCWQHV